MLLKIKRICIFYASVTTLLDIFIFFWVIFTSVVEYVGNDEPTNYKVEEPEALGENHLVRLPGRLTISQTVVVYLTQTALVTGK